MGRMRKKWIIWSVVFLLIFSSIPPLGVNAQNTLGNQTEKPVNSTIPPIKEREVGEIVEGRTENSKVFYNGDGTYTKNIYFENIHKKNGTKQFEEISTSLVEDLSNANEVDTENTVIETTFYKNMNNGTYAHFALNENDMSYTLVGASGNEKEAVKPNNVNATYKENDHKLLYKEVFPDIDLRNLVFNENVKEDLVLQSYQGYHIFTFKLTTQLIAEKQEDGSIVFTDKDSNHVFELPKPFMTDSNYDDHLGESAKSEKVHYELEQVEDGYLLTVHADPDWLSDPSRKFPVYIDPSTSVTTSLDTFVMSAYPTTNYYSTSSKWDEGQGQYVLKTGYYDSTTGTNYAFLNHSIASFYNMNVTSATFNVYVTHSYYATTANGLWLDYVNSAWSPSTITWDTKPTSTNIGQVDVARDQWAQFNVTNIVKDWASGDKKNYGFKLHTNGNGQTFWKKVVSTTNSNYKPYLSVTYTIPTPDTLIGKAYSNGDGTGYVNLSWRAVTGATGYKVWVYNGKDYESFDAGTSTSWSTKGKNIWPTTGYDLNNDPDNPIPGGELPVDPSKTYQASGGSYPNNTNYWFRVSAIFSQGESSYSEEFFRPTLPDLKVPSGLTGTTFSNGNGTGYIDFSWDAVTGAKGYKILLYNGKEYEELDVKNVTSWSTKGKKYWPTSTEIAAGKYNLHLLDDPTNPTNNNGTELAVDPSPVYKNSKGSYPNHTNYWIRVVAYNDLGETIRSNAYTPSITTMARPTAPSGFTYTNMLSSNSGYVILNWNKVSGATGYKIWMYNGKDYQVVGATGDTDTWTTQNKGIWPTQDEITSGRFLLHDDEAGAELALDPSPVYENSGGSYQTNKNYWFRISAIDDKGETIYSSKAFMPTFGEPVEFLGEEEYWSILDVPYGRVNMATGNLMVSEGDISISGRGPELGVSRTYNSLSDSVGVFGQGWHSDAEMTVKASSDNTQVKLVDEDGTVHLFTKLADGTYKAPTGVYVELTEDSTSFIVTTNDQTKAYFSKQTGRLSKVVDGNNNRLEYTYDTANKLTTITDASGRQLHVAYNPDGYVESIEGPASRKVSYTYENGFLTKVTQTAGEVTSYEYQAGKLVKVYEPNHTELEPVINQFVYDPETNQLKEAIDPKQYKYTLDYDATNKTVLFTQPKGNKIQYTYNEAGNPTKMIEDAGVGGLNITTGYEYVGNNLVDLIDPNDQGKIDPNNPGENVITEHYEYDSNGNILTATDHYGTETYQYNGNNDPISIKDTEGDQTTIAYEGLNPVSETDQTGKTSSIAKYQKDDNGNSNGNLIESSYALGTATNLVQNNSFENDVTNWSPVTGSNTGSLSLDSLIKPFGLSGNQSLKISTKPTSSTGYISAMQEIPVQAGKTYTLSGLLKTNLTKANAFFNVRFLDANNNAITWVSNRYNQIGGTRNWTERQFSFKTPDNTVKVRIYLEVEQTDATASGDAWFDMIQLEQADVSSRYNPINNSSFRGTLSGWSGTGGTIDSSNGFEDNTSLKVDRTSETQAASEYKQTITIGQTASDSPFPMTLTGLSKAENVVKKGTVGDRDYSIVGKVYYTDGTTKEYIANFPSGTQEWNRAAIQIPATKPVSKMDVTTVFGGNYTGTVWFDGIRLMKGSVLTKNTYDTAQNYVTETEDELGFITKSTYDAYGNTTTETDAKGEQKTYQYDVANQLEKLLLVNGTSLHYQYDKNGNMTSKKITTSNGQSQDFTYHYDTNGQLFKTIGPLNDTTVNEYEANGNLLNTQLPSGTILSYVYDGADRLKEVSYSGVTQYVYDYDQNGNEKTVQYPQENRMKTREYDASNRVKKQEDRGSIQEWTYAPTSDKLNELLVTHGSFVQRTTYQYNELDKNTIVNDGEFSYRFDYDERGQVKTFTTGNGAGTSFNYDERGLVEKVVVGLKDGQDVIDETYSYDANGNRTTIKYPDGQIAYEYGPLDQLEKETLKDGTILEYTYDGFGNRTLVKKTKDGQTTSIVSDYNTANQLKTFGTESIHYDANGNRTEDGSYIYKWNNQDQLESITKKGESTPFVTYKYDEYDRRIQKTIGSSVTKYFYDGDSINVLYETDGQDQVVRSYIYSESGQRLAMKKGSEKYFYHYNAHGDVVALTDKSGNVVATYEYDAWGNVLKAEETDAVKDNPYRYAGYQYDQEIGMYYLIARYYHPTHGVFLSLDPYPGDEDNVLTQNGYSYANNNPVENIDPDGQRSKKKKNLGKKTKKKKYNLSKLGKKAKKYIGKISEAFKFKGKKVNKKVKKLNVEKVKDSYLKRKGINAHKLKQDVLGQKAKIAHYDIYIDKNTKQLYLFKKGGKGEGIPTGEYIW